MTRALGPRQPITGTGATGPWIVLGLGWAAVAVMWFFWASARLAALVSGGRVTGFGIAFIADMARGRWAAAWPGTSTPLVLVLAAAIISVIAAAAAAAWVRFGGRLMTAPDDPVAALARNRHGVAAMTLPEVAKRATLLRASLAGRRPSQIPADDAGLAVGDLLRPGQPPGPVLYADWRSTLLAYMGPGAGKTTALAIPLTLDAPGAVLATSNKPDLWAATAEIRAGHGPVWLFDPLGICCQPQAFWVDFLSPLVNVEAAHRLASHFVMTVEEPGRRELWGPAAQTLLTGLFLAAAVSGRTLHDPALWLDQPSMPAPASLLEEAGYRKLASSLRGTQNGAPETRDGIYETARTASKALRDEAVIRWITPQPGLPSFSPAAFPESRGTLYLLSEKASYATPLIAAASDLVIRAGLQRARELGGRLDPPLPLLFDEGANIAKIAELPDMYSYLGSHGLQPLTILQSYEQGSAVWGESGMAAMWGAATVKLIGAGVQSPRLARDVSTLVGQHDVAVRSITLGEARGVSEQISLRRQEILDPAGVAAIDQGTALLMVSGSKPVLVKLRNWFSGPCSAEISQTIARATGLITEGAIRRARDQQKAPRP